MRTMSTIKAIQFFLMIAIGCTVSCTADSRERFAYFDTPHDGRVCLSGNMLSARPLHCKISLSKSNVDADAFKLIDLADKVYFVQEKNEDGRRYFMLLLRIPSVPEARAGYCGAGYEDILLAVGLNGKKLIYFDKFVIQSCLKAVALDSATPDDPLKSITVRADNGAIEFRWLINPDDRLHTLHMQSGKFVLN